jgi:nickel/cobalt exporter
MSPRTLGRLWAVIAAAAVTVLVRTASAHPAGFTSVNRYVGVQCDGQGSVHIAYLLDFAEFPAYAEIETLDADHDGTVTPAEQRAYLDGRLPPLLAQWGVEVNGEKASLRLVGSNLEAAPGERGLSTLRIAADIGVDVASPASSMGAEIHVLVRDRTFSDRSGWREMAAEDTPEAVVVSGLSARPGDALAYSSRAAMAPPRLDEANFTFRLREAPRVLPPGSPSDRAVVIDARIARLSSAMKRARGSWSFSVLAMALAFALGAAHALSPGHGKVMAAAYLVGRRARWHQAVLFGTSVTIAHTAVVFLVGCLALAVERMIGSDRLLRGLELVSAVAIVALGIVQLSRRWREATSTFAVHDHAHAGLGRGVGEKSDGARSLMALGVSSGLTPCPSALAVLLTAISLHRYGFGLILVLAFSLGIALTLTTTGLLVLTARRLLDRISAAAPVLRWLPVMSSSCVLLIGVLLFASAWSPG